MDKTPTSVLEKASIAAAILLLLGIGIYLYIYTANRYDLNPKPEYSSETPAEGEHISIDSVTTGFIKTDASDTYFPSATIRLSSDNSKNGAIRVFFRSDVGLSINESKVVGDSNTFEIKNGLFANGTNEVTITCTKGIENKADFLGYKSQDESRWVLKIREGESGSRESDFIDFTQAAIEPIVLK